MAVADLTNNDRQRTSTGKETVVIRDKFEEIRGGRTLDVTGYPLDVITAGHVLIKETATGEFKPFPLNAGGTAYATLPEDHEIAGILISTIRKDKPFAGILIRGSVNPNAAPFPMTAILSAVKTALPLITFLAD